MSLITAGGARARPMRADSVSIRGGSPTLVVGLGFAVIVRAVIAGSRGASSLSAAALFSLVLSGLILAAGWRPGRLRAAPVLLGVAGGAVLIIGPLAAHRTNLALGGLGASHMATWTVVVSTVALAEEAFFRGALWAALEREFGLSTPLLATTLVFAVVHIPLYGLRAVPLDLGVGLGLGALRIWSGGVAAPAIAHLLADLAGGWL